MSLGNNQITALSVIKSMFKKEVEEDLTTKINETTNKQVQSKNDILVQGLEDIKVNLSGCCKPIPGDKVVSLVVATKTEQKNTTTSEIPLGLKLFWVIFSYIIKALKLYLRLTVFPFIVISIPFHY